MILIIVNRCQCINVKFVKLWHLAALFLSLLGAFPAYSDEVSLQGSLSNRLKYRTTGTAKDLDWESLFSLDVGWPQVDRFSGSLLLGGLFDMDGRKGGTTFSSLNDALHQRAVGRIYYAYFDAKDLGPIHALRAGRQNRFEFESLYFDGASLEFKPVKNFTLSVLGGVPVHLFENQSGLDPGDWMVGSVLQWDPLTVLRFRFDHVHLKDKTTGFRSSFGDQQDDLFGGSFWWDVDRHVSLNSRFTAFSDQVRDFSFTTKVYYPEHDFSFRLQGYRLLKGYAIRVLDWDAFGVAGSLLPYTEFSMSSTKGFGTHWAVDGGVGFRFLDQPQVASAFNHGYERFFLALSSFDLPCHGLSMTVTTDYYHGRDNSLQNDNFAVSFTATQKLLGNRLRLSGGTQYYLYRYNLYAGHESNHVRTYFAQIRGKIFRQLEGRLGYEFEENPINNFHSLDTRLIWSF